ncbi:uncharacterized protein LOC125777482 [Bactrocera dorsalis]|uniref:Uncharacterized protein LOC125777482 n=2 Tax=Bactrocera dorsalis TaxID=27457 RepID=A0ABM3JH08_BACDO|nr:uncharacterized protein LOC125777482 [Bactrocera dorsalis]
MFRCYQRSLQQCENPINETQPMINLNNSSEITDHRCPARLNRLCCRMKFYVGILITVFCIWKKFAEAEQSYMVTNEFFEHYDGQTQTLFYADNMKIIGRQRSINGTMRFLEDMSDEHFMLSVEMFTAQHGESRLKPLPSVERIRICEGLKTYFREKVQPSLVYGENTDFPYIPEEGLCPLPKGEYYFKNVIQNINPWPTEVPRGILKTKMTFFKDGVNIGAWSLQMKLEDRE